MAKKDKKAMYSNFKIIGFPIIQGDVTKMVGNGKNKNGFIWRNFNLGIKVSDNNMLFVDMMGGTYGDNWNMTTRSVDNQEMKVAWHDRMSESVLTSVANWAKIKIGLDVQEDEYGNEKIQYKEFLSGYDAIPYIMSKLDKNKRVVVTGNVRYSRYKNKEGKWQVSQSFTFDTLRLAHENEENNATGIFEFLYNKDCWLEDLRENKKVMVETYVSTKPKGYDESIFIPTTFILNCEKIDFENEQMKEVFDFYKNCFKGSKIKRGKYYKAKWHCNIFRGSEDVEITENDLTDAQKTQIKLGIASFEDIKKDMRGSMAGKSKFEIRLIRPKSTPEGDLMEETLYNDEDFILNNDENFEDVLKKHTKKANEDDKPPFDVDEEDNKEDMVKKLFG